MRTDYGDRRLLCRKCDRDNVPALGTPRQMLQNLTSLTIRQQVLGERRQHIRVRMVDCDRRSLQPLSNDFG
jgi:hypothetical protein